MRVRGCVFILLCVVSQSGKTCGTRGPTPVPCGLQTKCLMMRMRTQIAQSSRFWQSRWFHRWDCSSGPSHCCPDFFRLKTAALHSLSLLSFSAQSRLFQKSPAGEILCWFHSSSFQVSEWICTYKTRSLLVVCGRIKENKLSALEFLFFSHQCLLCLGRKPQIFLITMQLVKVWALYS